VAQVKLLKIASDGVPLEFNSAADDITLNSFTVQGGGPVLSGTGLDMNNQDISDVNDLSFNDPTTGTINQTAGALIIDNIMAKERENTMTTAGGVAFPVITDTAGQVDAFRLPALAGVPSASPTNGGEGHMVWDSSNNKLMAWDGAAWLDISASGTATDVLNTYTAEVTIAARDVVYISSADNVSPAQADAAATSYAVGFANAGAAAAASVGVKTDGIIGGFSGLTAGARYYLSAATAGLITSTLPVGTGNTIVQVGYAKSATDVQIQLLQLGRRA
jgi:hypothetical protein